MTFAGHTGTGAPDGPAPFPKVRYQEVARYASASLGGKHRMAKIALNLDRMSVSDKIPKGRTALTVPRYSRLGAQINS